MSIKLVAKLLFSDAYTINSITPHHHTTEENCTECFECYQSNEILRNVAISMMDPFYSLNS